MRLLLHSSELEKLSDTEVEAAFIAASKERLYQDYVWMLYTETIRRRNNNYKGQIENCTLKVYDLMYLTDEQLRVAYEKSTRRSKKTMTYPEMLEKEIQKRM
jgi:hypothetical protein